MSSRLGDSDGESGRLVKVGRRREDGLNPNTSAREQPLLSCSPIRIGIANERQRWRNVKSERAGYTP